MLNPLTYFILLAAVSVYAAVRGRADERIAVAICIAATIATNFVVLPLQTRYSGVETGVLLIDVLTLAGFTLLALRSDRFWPLWVAGLQLTTIMSHAMMAIEFDLMPQAYAAAARFWVYPIFLIIVAATWRAHRRRVRSELLREQAV